MRMNCSILTRQEAAQIGPGRSRAGSQARLDVGVGVSGVSLLKF